MSLSTFENQAPMPTQKKVLIETWGCQMNVADSEEMLRLLHEQNYAVTTNEQEADLILLNTCHIREKAKHKVLSRLGILKSLKKDNPDLTIAVTGCVAQAEGKKLIEQAPTIDVLLGPGKIKELPRLLAEQKEQKQSVLAVGFDRHKETDEAAETAKALIPKPTLNGKTDISRFVNIQQGCDNFCTFCVVPFTRGREISDHPDLIVKQVEALVREGAREITLLGQNVNSYGNDLVKNGKLAASEAGPFADLLQRVARLPGLARLRFTTSNPHDFTKSLAELFGKEETLGRYLHLPVQSGDDTVLERMRRKVTVAEYLERIAWLKQAVPDIALSTDLIVGFPGETEEQFDNTLKLVEQVRYSFIYSFKYSPRKGTAAARFLEQVPQLEMDRRLAALNALQDKITNEQIEEEIGKEHVILCHYESKKNPGHFYGRTPHFRLVRIETSKNLAGQLVPIKIVEGNKTALIGKLL